MIPPTIKLNLYNISRDIGIKDPNELMIDINHYLVVLIFNVFPPHKGRSDYFDIWLPVTEIDDTYAQLE